MCANARNKSQHAGSLDKNTKDSGTQIPTIPYIPLFGSFSPSSNHGRLACSARAPVQLCWMCCANEPNNVGPRFDDRETIEMLALLGAEVWPVSNFIQQLPTSRNNTQHGVQTLATCWAQQCCVLLANNIGTLRNRTAGRLRTAEWRIKMSRKTGNAQSRATFFRHSAVLLRKVPNVASVCTGHHSLQYYIFTKGQKQKHLTTSKSKERLWLCQTDT